MNKSLFQIDNLCIFDLKMHLTYFCRRRGNNLISNNQNIGKNDE